MLINILNDDPFGNNVVVVDRNAGNQQIFSGYIGAHQSQQVTCRASDAGYGNIATSNDGGPWIGRSLLNDGDTVSL